MSQADKEAQPPASASSDARLAALHAAGANAFDPVTMRLLEAMARRACTQPDAVRRLLDARIEQTAASLALRHEEARLQASQMLAAALERFPQARIALQRHADIGDVQGLKRELMALQSREQSLSLTELTRELEQDLARHAPASNGRAELKTLSTARTAWSQASAHKQVAQALALAPKNAGPINSHMLMLRSLEIMREISPDYLHRFISYADTLLRLEECGPKQAKQPDKTEKPKKPRARTARSKPGPK